MCLLTAPRTHAIKTGSQMCPNMTWVYGIHEMISIKEQKMDISKELLENNNFTTGTIRQLSGLASFFT